MAQCGCTWFHPHWTGPMIPCMVFLVHLDRFNLSFFSLPGKSKPLFHAIDISCVCL